MRVIAFLFLCLAAVNLAAAEPKWEKIEGCTLVRDGYRDGDSFVVRIKPRTFRVLRLYFVDSPEDTADQRFPDRIADQAKYFGVTPARSIELGDEAVKFSETALSKPFTVWTCWQEAPGASSRQRFYAMIEAPGGNLGELLVANGLARIYGKRITLPDGMDSRTYLAKLAGIEEKAKAARIGGWRR